MQHWEDLTTVALSSLPSCPGALAHQKAAGLSVLRVHSDLGSQGHLSDLIQCQLAMDMTHPVHSPDLGDLA